jgi:hypothetical protein
MATTIDELAARLADLEARLVAPRAVPPVTIGEYTDVPAPGSPIASQWATEATRRTVHRFANAAARDAAYPAASAGTGAMCITTDNGMLYTCFGGQWIIPSRQFGNLWTNVTFMNGWVNYDGTHPAQYRRIDGGDTVALRGLIKGGATGTQAFAMPAGFRPSQADETFPTTAGAGVANVSVFSSGVVSIAGPGVATFCYLSGIIYSTA